MTDTTSGKRVVKLSEVLNAIRVIKRYLDVKEKISELLISLASAGVDISRVNFNNPMSLISVLNMAKNRGVDVDIDTLLEEIDESYDITIDEVNEAVRVLRVFAQTSSAVDSTLRVFGRNAKASARDIESIAAMFGLKTPSSKLKEEEPEVEEEINDEEKLSEEDLEDIKTIVQKFKGGEL